MSLPCSLSDLLSVPGCMSQGDRMQTKETKIPIPAPHPTAVHLHPLPRSHKPHLSPVAPQTSSLSPLGSSRERQQLPVCSASPGTPHTDHGALGTRVHKGTRQERDERCRFGGCRRLQDLGPLLINNNVRISSNVPAAALCPASPSPSAGSCRTGPWRCLQRLAVV